MGSTERCESGKCDVNVDKDDVPKKQLVIDFLYLDLNTCNRCISTDSTLKEAIAVLIGVFDTLNYTVIVNKVNIYSRELAEKYHFVSSPTIKVNGVDICNEIKENNCKECGDICGDIMDCRVFTFEGREYEQPPKEMIVDGILQVIYKKKTKQNESYTLPSNLEKYFNKGEKVMKKIEIYDPAMCCSTGVCGPSIDQELLRIATLVDVLNKNGANIIRYNLSSSPQAFVTNQEINRLLKEDNDILPITVVDGKVVKTKTYLTNQEFSDITGMIIINQAQATEQSCCCEEKQEDCCSDEDHQSDCCCNGNQEGCC